VARSQEWRPRPDVYDPWDWEEQPGGGWKSPSGRLYSSNSRVVQNVLRARRGERMPDHYMNALHQFHQATCQGQRDHSSLAEDDGQVIELRIKLIAEEATELFDALRSRVPEDVAKELADLLYTAFGTAERFDIPIGPVFMEVHRSNMTKIPAEGELVLREDGKVLKSDGYQPARVGAVLDAWGYQR
jgi:NTP pyrophosphatase (non-canonical NTP hydrolase)